MKQLHSDAQGEWREGQDRLFGLEGEETRQVQDAGTFQDLPVRPKPRFVATPIILTLNVLVFALMALSGVSVLGPWSEDLLKWGASYGPLVFSGEWWRLFTAIFVHIGILHLALNMQCLWRLGNLAERLFGSGAFSLLYVLSGLGGALASLWWRSNVVSAGASGAIFGIAGGLVVVLYRGRFSVPQRVIQSNLTSILLFVAYNLFYGFAQSGIDNAAHLGGLVTGAAISALLIPTLSPARGRSRLVRFLVIIGAMLVLILGTAFVKGRDPMANLMRAEALLEAGDTDQAIAEIENALERDPDLAMAHFLLGNAYLEKERHRDAIASYTQAVSLDPQLVEAYFNRGIANTVTAQYDDALADFDRAIELGLDDGQAFFLRGLVYADLGKRERAIADLEKALVLGLDPQRADYAESVLQGLKE